MLQLVLPMAVLAQTSEGPAAGVAPVQEHQDVRREIRQERKDVKQDIQKKREQLKQDVQQKREQLKEGLKEKRDAVKQNVNKLRQEVKQKGETMKQEVKEKREALREEVKQKRQVLQEEIQKKRNDFQEQVKARRDELKKKLGEQRAERIEHFFNKAVEKMHKAVDRLGNLADRIEERLHKAENNGKDVGALKEKLNQARAKITDVLKAVEEAKTAYSEAIKNPDLKAAFVKVHEIVKGVEVKIREAHRALVDVVNSTKGLGGGTVAPVSPSVSPAPATGVEPIGQ